METVAGEGPFGELYKDHLMQCVALTACGHKGPSHAAVCAVSHCTVR